VTLIREGTTDSVRLHGVQFRVGMSVRPWWPPLWEFPAIEITDKIEQALASSASATAQLLLLRIVLRQMAARPCLSLLVSNCKDWNGRMADSSVAEIGRAKSDGTVGKTKQRDV
jgi:hypothetical protein